MKHLRGADRAVVTFSGDEAWVLFMGPHVEGDVAADVYSALYELAGVSRPTQPRTEPPCCDEVQAPPRLDQPAIDQLVQRGRALRR